MECPYCEIEMDTAGITEQYPDCNCWKCPECDYVWPDIASAKLVPLVGGKNDEA